MPFKYTAKAALLPPFTVVGTILMLARAAGFTVRVICKLTEPSDAVSVTGVDELTGAV
jgi:hypothetical protein